MPRFPLLNTAPLVTGSKNMESTGMIVPTGLAEADALICTSEKTGHTSEILCPLTMESIYSKNNSQFLKETFQTIAKNPLL